MKWHGHMIKSLYTAYNLIWAIWQSYHLKLLPPLDLQGLCLISNVKPTRLTLNIRYQTYTCYLNLYSISTRQLFRFNPTSFWAMQIRLSIFIFHFLVVMLEHINFILLGSARAYQPCTTNKSHKTGGNNVEACTILHYLAL